MDDSEDFVLNAIAKLDASVAPLFKELEQRFREDQERQLAAARLAGKIEGMEEAYTAALNIKEMPLEKEGDAMLSAIRAKIAELQATTTPALPGASEPA